MSTRSEPPLEAKVLPDLPEPRRVAGSSAWSWIFATSAFLGFMALFAFLLWGIGRFIHNGRELTPGRTGSLIQHWETPAERLAACRAALEVNVELPSAVELRELDRFFTRVTESRQWPTSVRLEALFDLDALTDRVLRHPDLAKVDRTSRQRLRRQLDYDDQPWPEWTEFQIVSVQRGARDELLVYTIAAQYGRDPEPVRWWLRRRGRAWRIADWERLVTGYSEASRRALEEALVTSEKQPAFRRTLEAIRGALTNREANNLPLAAQQLLDVSAGQFPGPASDLINIELAFAWHSCGRPDQVLAACERVSDVAANPTVRYLQALVHAEREQFAETAAAAATYREQAGIHPRLLELQAEALEALGRSAEAARCWDDRLALLPNDRRALAERARLAGDAAPRALATALAKGRDPTAMALSAGVEAIGDDDDALYDAVSQFLHARPGAEAALARLRGERLAHHGQYQTAAEQFHRAWQNSLGDTTEEEAFKRYLDAMVQCGRAAAGYGVAPVPAEAFTFLMEGLEDGESPISLDDLPLLLAAHRRQVPGDVQIHYYQGLLDLAAGRAVAAEQRFASGEAAAEDDALRERLRSKRLEALYLQKRLADAYQAYSADRELIFRELAWLCHRHQDWPALDQLIDLHRGRNAADPWIDYFLALKHEAQGNDAEALAAAKRAESAEDESLGPQLDWLKSNLELRVEGIARTYLNSNDQREAFRRLVNHLARAEDWDGILELTDLYSAGGRQRSSSIYWSAKAQWNCGEYEKVAANLSPWPYDRLSRLDGEQIAELYDIAVRSLLRVGRIDDATETARHARDEYGLELPQIAVALAQNDPHNIRELLGQRRIARALFHQPLHRDRDLASLLTNPEVADFRRQHALAWPEEHGQRNVSLVLFYRQPPTSDEVSACQQSLAGVGAASTFTAADGRQSWLWHVGADTLALTRGTGPYCSCDDLPLWLRADDPRRAILEQHGGWIAIDLLLADQAIRNSVVRPAAAQLAAALVGHGAPACYVIGPRGLTGRPLLIDAAVQDDIQSGRIFRAEVGAPGINRMLLWPPAVIERSALAAPALASELTRVAHRSRVASAAGHARIRVRLKRGHATEDLWLTVIRSRRALDDAYFGGEEFVAELTADSRLWPYLKTGERLLVARYLPLEVTSLAGGSASASSPPGR